MQAMEKQMRAERGKKRAHRSPRRDAGPDVWRKGAKAAAASESEGKLQAMKNQASGDAIDPGGCASRRRRYHRRRPDAEKAGRYAGGEPALENYLEQFGKLARRDNLP